VLPTYQILLSSRKPVNSLADVEGLKIRTAGGALDLMMRGIKAVPIRMSPQEIYESMSRGTLDGAMLGYQSAAAYDLLGLLKTGTLNEPLSSVVITYSISGPNGRRCRNRCSSGVAVSCERLSQAAKLSADGRPLGWALHERFPPRFLRQSLRNGNPQLHKAFTKDGCVAPRRNGMFSAEVTALLRRILDEVCADVSIY
jgi:hypothetical protein